MSRSKFEGTTKADGNQPGTSCPAEIDGFLPLAIPVAAVIMRLRNRTLVKVLSEAGRRSDPGEL